jgi:predicted dehydrogenase
VERLSQDFERNQLFLDEMRHFLVMCREGVDPICDLEDGIEALRIALAAKQSSKSGERVSMSEGFPSQDETS